MCIKVQFVHNGYQIFPCDAVRHDPEHRICTGNKLFIEDFRVVKDVCNMSKEAQVNKSAGLLFNTQLKGLSDPTGSGGKDMVSEVVEGVKSMNLEEDTAKKA